MQIKTFKIPLGDTSGMEEELNKFLRTHRVLKLERSFCLDGSGYLAVCVEYLEGELKTENGAKPVKRDVTKDLTEQEMDLYERFRKKRRELAAEKSLPAYMVFTDADLAVLAKQQELTLENILEVPGIQKNRLKEYGAFFVNITTERNETGGEFDASGSPF